MDPLFVLPSIVAYCRRAVARQCHYAPVSLTPAGKSKGGGGTRKTKSPKSKTQCALEAAKSNGVALGLDVATIGVDIFVPEVALAAGLIQGATAAKAAVQGGVAIAAFANSGLRNETSGAVAGVAGFELTSVGLFAKGIKRHIRKCGANFWSWSCWILDVK